MKSCVIFGAGLYGDKAYSLLRERYKLLAYIDNDARKQNSECNGLRICPPSELEGFGDCDVVIAAKAPYPIVEQLRAMAIHNPMYLFDPRSKEGRYLFYRVEDGNICVPEYMNFRYTEDSSLRCHYSDLPKDVQRLFSTALKWIEDEFDTGVRIVELGCGSGQFANMLFERGYTNYTGYDFSSTAIARAIEWNPKKKDRFFERDIRNINIPIPMDGLAILFEVLEHLIDDVAIVKKIPEGSTILFTVPNFNSFNHVRKFDDLNNIVKRYGQFIDFDRYQRIRSTNRSCWFLLQGTKRGKEVLVNEIQ